MFFHGKNADRLKQAQKTIEQRLKITYSVNMHIGIQACMTWLQYERRSSWL